MKESKVFSVRLPVKEIERLKEAKWDLRKPINKICHEAISEYLDKHLKKVKKRRSEK